MDWADPFLLRRAIFNLLQNAIDFSPTGGAIRVGLSCTRRDLILIRLVPMGFSPCWPW